MLPDRIYPFWIRQKRGEVGAGFGWGLAIFILLPFAESGHLRSESLQLIPVAGLIMDFGQAKQGTHIIRLPFQDLFLHLPGLRRIAFHVPGQGLNL